MVLQIFHLAKNDLINACAKRNQYWISNMLYMSSRYFHNRQVFEEELSELYWCIKINEVVFGRQLWVITWICSAWEKVWYWYISRFFKKGSINFAGRNWCLLVVPSFQSIARLFAYTRSWEEKQFLIEVARFLTKLFSTPRQRYFTKFRLEICYISLSMSLADVFISSPLNNLDLFFVKLTSFSSIVVEDINRGRFDFLFYIL